jgi:hypothetical protein
LARPSALRCPLHETRANRIVVHVTNQLHAVGLGVNEGKVGDGTNNLTN